jgi:hypothetical protein
MIIFIESLFLQDNLIDNGTERTEAAKAAGVPASA